MTDRPAWLRRLAAGAIGGMALALSVPPMRHLIEQSMVWHMAVQMPLLVIGGWLAMGAASRTRASRAMDDWNRYGLTGLIAAQAILAYWMLPLALDRAVVLPGADGVKLLSLWAAGGMLRHSVERAPAILQLFFVGTTASMLTWLGLYFATTDLRLCNAYSLETQALAGRAAVLWGIMLGALWGMQAVAHLRRAGRAHEPFSRADRSGPSSVSPSPVSSTQRRLP